MRRLSDAGWALKHSAPRQKHLAHALDVSPSTITRMIAGELPNTVADMEALVRTLVTEGRANVGHVIGHLMSVAEEAAIDLGVDEVARRLCTALAHETDAQAQEDRAEYRLAVALGCLAHDPTDSELAELRAALEGHDEAVRHETAWHVETLIYGRAMRVLMGWRAAPDGGT